MSKAKPSTVRIATFNTENLDNTAVRERGILLERGINERITLMRPQLQRMRADVLCVQEVNNFDALGTLIANTPYATFKQVVSDNSATQPGNRQQNVAILSRFAIGQHERVLHKFIPAPVYKLQTAQPPEKNPRTLGWTRQLLYAQLKLPDKRLLHIITMHLKSKLPYNIPGQTESGQFGAWKSASAYAEGAFISSMLRMGQALEARMLVDSIFDQDPNALIVVCGDLNADPDDVPLTALRGDVENTANPKLAPRVLVACANAIAQPNRYSLIHHGRGELIDHILVSRSLFAHFRHAEIHNELLHDESSAFATDDKYPESDHAPVVAEFEL